MRNPIRFEACLPEDCKGIEQEVALEVAKLNRRAQVAWDRLTPEGLANAAATAVGHSDYSACITWRIVGDDRSRLDYWSRQAIKCGADREDRILEKALNMMAIREIPVLAEDADKALGLDEGTTRWFNKGSAVPAQAVLDEINQRNPGRKRNPENGRLI
jgi:hypothetical protein